VINVETLEAAEFVKVAGMIYRDVNIALANELAGYAERAGVDCVALDVQASAELGRRLQTRTTIQGALDPLLLRAGGDALDRRVLTMLEQWGQGPYVFNLGHGILPDTPPEHVARVVELVTGKA